MLFSTIVSDFIFKNYSKQSKNNSILSSLRQVSGILLIFWFLTPSFVQGDYILKFCCSIIKILPYRNLLVQRCRCYCVVMEDCKRNHSEKEDSPEVLPSLTKVITTREVAGFDAVKQHDAIKDRLKSNSFHSSDSSTMASLLILCNC